LLASFAVEEKAPRSVAIISVDTVFFQCTRAIVRADLWNPASRADPSALPTPGTILAALTARRTGGESYDLA
jgi:uncharacterized protein